MKYISEITITGIIKEYVEGFRRRTERENKNLLHSILYKVENICFARIKELEEENAELKETVARSGYRIAELKHEIDELKAKIEDMQIMEYANQRAQGKKMHKNLIDGFTEQLGIMDKEEDELFSLKEIKSIINSIMELAE